MSWWRRMKPLSDSIVVDRELKMVDPGKRSGTSEATIAKG
jgi:hypothetical protein